VKFFRHLAEAFGRRPLVDPAAEVKASTQRAVAASEELVKRLNEPLDRFTADVRSSGRTRKKQKAARQ
jgi:hypothetical protein